MENNLNQPNVAKEEEFNFKQLFEQYAFYWKWFLLSIIVCLVGATLYLRYAEKIYSVSAKILLQNEKEASGELSGLSELANISGYSPGSAFVSDQIDILKSRRIVRKVVEESTLNISYFSIGKVKSTEVLAKDSPIKLIPVNSNNPKLDSLSYTANIVINDENSFDLTDNNRKLKNLTFGSKIESPLGVLMILPNGIIKRFIGNEFKVTYQPINKSIDFVIGSVDMAQNKDKQSYVVNLTMENSLREKAELILNSIIQKYNEDVSNDKNQVNKATTDFINKRLELISVELSDADRNVANFKDDNRLVDMANEAQLYLQTATENEKRLLEAETQLTLATLMKESIKPDNSSLLPSNIGLQDGSIEQTIANYNRIVLERDDLLKSATSDNPVVKNLNDNLSGLNKSLKTSLDNYVRGLQLKVTSLSSQQSKFQGKLGNIPGQEEGFKNISRQQQIVESIYLFLLQKREETEIQAAATPANLKVIDEAYGADRPVAPRKFFVFVAAIFISLLVPFGFLYLKFLLDNKVHSRKDIEARFSAPILGEIPASEDPVVKDNDRSSLAEAFRILRTNISFMIGTKKDSAVVFVTSTTSGEGKSFVATNLSRILAMSGKKVLLIGADIRSPKVLDYLGLSHLQHTNIGITQYLINPDMPVDNIIIHKPTPYDFDIIYSGYIAPNPAELLMNGHFKEVVEYGRQNYDYVLVDTAPVSLVTDTLLISEFADLTVYVTRANYLDKRLLNVPKELYEQGKLKNMAVVLNDVDFARGYGYGYGYGYIDSSSVSLRAKFKKQFRKLFKKNT